jgi:HAD superfamily hydrolase (TIGR01509 family)
MEFEMDIKLVLFDLDGVLVDACDWHYEALNRALISYEYTPISREDHETTFNGLPTKVKLNMLGISDSIGEEINNLKQQYTMDIIENNASIMQEKIELHKYLKSSGIEIACVTNSIEETAKKMLIGTGQFEYIDLLVSNEKVKRNKPYPDCYNYAINTMEVDPSLCLCVEDSDKGIAAAVASIAEHLWVVSDTTKVTKENYMKFMEEKSANIDTNGG